MARLRIPEYVELDRTFKALPDREILDDNQRLDPESAFGKSLTWNDLLAKQRVVILSEAGSGKTKEILRTAQRLRDEGKPAFFMRLENVCTRIVDAFDVGTHEDFQDWLQTEHEAWIFLDSVDEARLHSPKDFEHAIRAINRLLGNAGARARIVLTSRASEWRPVTDLRLCETHIPLHRPEGQSVSDSKISDDSKSTNSDESFQFVTLEDLNCEQAVVFAKACALEELDSFFTSLDHVGEGTYHSRPADLLRLFELWHNKRKLGTRFELIHESIQGRLTERDQDRDQVRPLDRDKAHQAAKSLAAAATLSRCQEILVPDSLKHRNGIDVEDVLTDWNGTDRITFLSRPLFDEKTYGTVRFHHRSAREYLTAEWFADLLSKRSSRRSVEALFFREQYGRPIVAPVLRPILPWLVHLDSHICRLVQERAPEILLEGGDPASLPVETRRAALAHLCERIASGECDKWLGASEHISGFAHEGLTESVRTSWVRHTGDAPVLEFLLHLIWKGRLNGAWEDVNHLLLTGVHAAELGSLGLHAANSIGTKGQLRALRESYLGTVMAVARESMSSLIDGLSSDEDESQWLKSALSRCSERKPHSYDSLEQRLTEYVERLAVEHLPALLQVFDAMLHSEDESSDQEELPHRHFWLLPHACQVMSRLIKIRHAAALDHSGLSVLQHYSTARISGTAPYELKQDLRALVAEWPELSLAHFWNTVDLMREANQPLEPQINWRQALIRTLFQADPILFPWMIEAIACKASLDDRLLAMSLACHLYCEAERPATWLVQLKDSATSSPELSALLEQCTAPPTSQVEQDAGIKVKQWQAESDAKQTEIKRKRDEYFSALRANLAALRKAMADD